MSTDYWKNVFQVSTGVVLGQIIGILGYILLTWTFAPQEFGVYITWLALVAFGAVVCTGALETSLVQEEDGRPRHNAALMMLVSASLGTTLYSICCLAVLSCFPSLLVGDPGYLTASIALSAFCLGGNSIFQSWAASEGHFKSLTVMRIVQSLSITLTPLMLGQWRATSAQLICGHALGLLLALLFWIVIFKPDRINLAVLPDFWRARKRCFVYVLPAHVVGACIGNLPQLAVSSGFGYAAAGHMALAQRVLGTPLSLVGVAVRDVFKRHASVAFRERGECQREFWNSFLILGVIAIAFAIVTLFGSEYFFVTVFGEQWRMSSTIANWLLPMFAIGIVASPLTYLVYIVRREDFDFYWQSILLGLVLTCFMAIDDLSTTLRTYAFVYALMYCLYLLACAHFASGRGLFWRRR